MGGMENPGAKSCSSAGRGGEGRVIPAPRGGVRIAFMTQPSAAPKRYLIKSPETWELVRSGYMRGETGPVLAARYGVSVANIRYRARREGWTRRALAMAEGERWRAAPQLAPGPSALAAAWSTAGRLDPADGGRGRDDGGGYGDDGAELAEADPLEAARLLLRRAAAAATAGRLGRAQEAVKLAEGLARAAAALGLEDEGEGLDDAYEPRLTPEQREALRDALERRFARFDEPEEGPGEGPGEGDASAPSRGSWEAARAGVGASGRAPNP